jgi:hypothetical protein
MAFKLMQAAQGTWCSLDAHDLLPLVRAEVRFVDGVRTQRAKPSANRKQQSNKAAA